MTRSSQNVKREIRNPKFETNLNDQNGPKFQNGPVLSFDIAVQFVSDFDIRISDLVWR
jgi:hypothetical protein